MSTLYELTENMIKLQQMFAVDEIDEDTFRDTMDSLQMDVVDKADGYSRVIRNMDATVAAIKAEEDRLKDRRTRIAKKIDLMKENLKSTLQVMNMKKVQTDLFTISITQNPPKVVIEDESKVPKKYIIMEPKIDKAAIREALQEGIKVRSCSLERGESLRIK
jgi:hypothetical protein